MSRLSVWESAHHFVIESWYYVDVHMENFLRSSSTIRLSDTDAVSRGGFLNALHDLVHGGEDTSSFLIRHFKHVCVVFFWDH